MSERQTRKGGIRKPLNVRYIDYSLGAEKLSPMPLRDLLDKSAEARMLLTAQMPGTKKISRPAADLTGYISRLSLFMNCK
jgi:hypothetical protein